MEDYKFELFSDNFVLKNKNSILVFVINDASLNKVNIVVEKILNDKNIFGLVFVIDKSIFFKKLYFLKSHLIKLHLVGKKIGIFGLPYCFMQSLFGELDYIKLKPLFIKKLKLKIFNNDYFMANSIQLIGCKNCIKSDSCFGLGNNSKNFSRWNFRLNQMIRTSGKNLFFKSNDKKILSVHNKINNYLLNSDLEYTDRSIEYVCTFKDDDMLITSDRIVYFARYLYLKEFKDEFTFLRSISVNKLFIEEIEKKYKNFVFSGYAFSVGKVAENSYRETFYLWPAISDSQYFLDLLNISFNLFNFFLKDIFFIGIDFLDGNISAYKLYFRVFDKALFKKIGIEIDFFNFNTNNILFICRLDSNFNLNSYKIEPWFDKRDINFYPKEYMDIYLDSRIYITRVSYDFNLDGTFRKFSIYYGPNYLNY